MATDEETPLDETLYRQVILDHARNPRNSGRLESHTHMGEASNPLCGDELVVTVAAEGASIREIRALVRGCVIAQAGASLMTEVVQGRDMVEARELGATFKSVLEGGEAAMSGVLEALQPLVAVKKHRSRIRCALLAWEALDAMKGPGAAP